MKKVMKDDTIEKTIEHLRFRLAQVEAALAILESRSAALHERSNRGRKSMGAEERIAVSERMKRYWGEHPKRRQKGTA